MDFVSRAAAERREAMLSKIALGRFGTLGEISALACWLASEEVHLAPVLCSTPPADALPIEEGKELAMIISAPTDYREAAELRLPRFLVDYIDGGAVTEGTMKQNVEELASINLRGRVLRGVGTPSLETEVMGQK